MCVSVSVCLSVYLCACVPAFHYVFDNRLAFYFIFIIMSLIFLSLCCFFFFFFSCAPHSSVIVKRFELLKVLYKFQLLLLLKLYSDIFQIVGSGGVSGWVVVRLF